MVNPGPLYSFMILPINPTVQPGQAVQFTVKGRDAGGYYVPTPNVEWSVAPASASAGTISSTGLFTAGTIPGMYSNAIVATIGSMTDTTSVIVDSFPP